VSGNQSLPEPGLPPTDLGARFGVGDERRNRLRSILPKAETPASGGSVREQDQEVVDRSADVPERIDPERTAPERTAADRTPAADVEAGTRQLIVYMPDRLRARLRKAAIGSTQLDVMLDAVEQTEREGVLEQLVTEHQAPDTSGLFDRRPARGSESTVQVNARAMHQHVAVLDRLADRYGTNRSELIRVALDHVLPGGRRPRR
jgi:hypothetical protein